MNTSMIIGNLTKDPEQSTAKGVVVCKFTVAINRGFGENKNVDYIPVVTWRGLAENCAKYLAKGRKVGIRGELRSSTYEKDGQTHYAMVLEADRVEFLSPKAKSDEPESVSDEGAAGES